MVEKNDGGNAFPSTPAIGPNGNFSPPYPGMTLRDWFAGQALTIIAGRSWDHLEDGINKPTVWASLAYSTADAMLAERSCGPHNNGERAMVEKFEIGRTYRGLLTGDMYTVEHVMRDGSAAAICGGEGALLHSPSDYEEVVPKAEKTAWVNLYRTDNGNMTTGMSHESRSLADDFSMSRGKTRIACKRIVIVEGEFDE